MALSSIAGTFTVTAASTVGTTIDVQTGLGWTVKAGLLFWSGRATVGQGEGDSKFGAGFFTSTSSRRAFTTQSDHGAGTSACDCMWRNDAVVCTLTIAGAVDGLLDVNLVSTGLQCIVDDQFSADTVIGYVLWGDSDITNTTIIDITEPAATGNQDYNAGFALNTGADDKIVIFLGGPTQGANTGDTTTSFAFGVAAGNTITQGLMTGGAGDAAAISDTCAHASANWSIGLAGADVMVSRGSLTTWLSTGFRINWDAVLDDLDPGLNVHYSALVIKGGRWQVGNSTTATDTSNHQVSTAYTPKSLLIGSRGTAAQAATVTAVHDERIIGAATSASARACASMLDKDNETTAEDIGIAQTNDSMYLNQSTAATIATEGIMDLVSLDATPGFTYVMDDADPGAEFFFWAIGADAPGGGATIDPSILYPHYKVGAFGFG